MQRIAIGGLHISRLVLGGRFGEQDEALSYDLLDAYVAAGGNAVDTAHAYACGGSERLLGNWLSARGNRERMIVIDKGCHPAEDQPRRVTPRCIRDDIEESLARLGSPYIDLFLLHRDDEEVGVGPLLDALNGELEAGRVRAFGASNWRRGRLAEAAAYASRHGLAGFSVSSCGFSLALAKEPMWPETVHLDREEWGWYRETRMPLLAWSSQARGWFSGAYTSGRRSDADVERVYDSAENRARLTRARQLAQQRGTTPTRIALAFVLSQPFPTLAIIGPERVEELKESADLPEPPLSVGELAYLEGDAEHAEALREAV